MGAFPDAKEMTEPNFENRTLYCGDNLAFLRGINSATVNLIATDPPFNKGRDFHATPDSLAKGASFTDRWSWGADVQAEWVEAIKDSGPGGWAVIEAARAAYGPDMAAFLCWLGVRLLEMHRILRPDGSLYLHIDHTAHAYVKAFLDATFGRKQFVDAIIWNYGTPSGGRASGKKPVKVHDVLLVYACEYGRHTYNRQFTPYREKYITDWFCNTDENGRKYKTRSRQGAITRQYLDESPGVPLSNVWSDIMQLYGSAGWWSRNTKADERTGYPTQKPLALYERIIQASSNPGDIVLDPFCGCGTTLVAAERLDRQWVGMGISGRAHQMVLDRLASAGLAAPDAAAGPGQQTLTLNHVTYSTTPPRRSECHT